MFCLYNAIMVWRDRWKEICRQPQQHQIIHYVYFCIIFSRTTFFGFECKGRITIHVKVKIYDGDLTLYTNVSFVQSSFFGGFGILNIFCFDKLEVFINLSDLCQTCDFKKDSFVWRFLSFSSAATFSFFILEIKFHH